MHPPRFAYPQYNQNQLGQYGHRFDSRWSMQYNNHYRQSNFQNNKGDHWCETCDRGFRTIQLLANHKQEHQKCNIDGCQFIAHPKVITKHIQMQHSTGLYKKIAKLENPEEIQKWREERKKRYPTKENIEKKSAEIKEKNDRGEKMGMRYNKGNKPNRTEDRKRKYNHDMNKQNFKRRLQTNHFSTEITQRKMFDVNKKYKLPKKENEIIPNVKDSKALKPFAGILDLVDDTDEDNVREDNELNDPIEDDCYIVMNEPNETPTEPIVCGALTSIISNYESSDEELDCETTEKGNNEFKKHNKVNNKQNEATKADLNLLKSVITPINVVEKSDDDSGPEEATIVKAVEPDRNIDTTSSCKKEISTVHCSKRAESKNRTNNTKNILKKFKPKLPSTLLEKLLHTEIRHERNVILQCIRYILKNNYFENKRNT